MLKTGKCLYLLDLQTDEYTFGRGEMCHYQFNTEEMRKHPCFPAYSKIHFKLSRVSAVLVVNNGHLL